MSEQRLEEIRAVRLEKRKVILARGGLAYPAEAQRSHFIGDVRHDFAKFVRKSDPIVLVGRVRAMRQHGGIVFIDIFDATGSIQLQISKDIVVEEILARLEELDVGDFIQISGQATTTRRNVQTIMIAEWHMLAKSVRPLPSNFHGLKDHETRWRHRELDILLNDKVRSVLIKRSEIIQWLRRYFTTQGYLEVDTPILQSMAGGAAAKPFATHHQAFDLPLFLRVAAELNLKRLLVAGFEKVFEIGQRFRNEGVDRQHNPEFTMLESQWAYADYEDLMNFTEDMFESLSNDILGTTDITWQTKSISLNKPFKRVRYVDILREHMGVDILSDKNPRTYINYLESAGIELPTIKNYTHLVDELYKNLIRPNLLQPTLVYDYPAEMAPLAKRAGHDDRVAEKFQLVIAGLELCNCYTELNDPVLQSEIFIEQQAAHEAGDEEAALFDSEYITAMEHGMPPNAGFGLGVDRLVMILTDSTNIRDVIPFPLLRPKSV